MSTAKQEVRLLLDGIPDDATFEDIQYHIDVREKIERGLKDVEEGRVVSEERRSHSSGTRVPDIRKLSVRSRRLVSNVGPNKSTFRLSDAITLPTTHPASLTPGPERTGNLSSPGRRGIPVRSGGTTAGHAAATAGGPSSATRSPPATLQA